jgi:beta-glucosidase
MKGQGCPYKSNPTIHLKELLMLFTRTHSKLAVCLAFIFALISSTAGAQAPKTNPQYPWSDASLSPDQRVDLVVKEMTVDEKISLLHGQGTPAFSPTSGASNGGAGYVNGIPRLGIPAIQMADSAYGVTRAAAAGRYSTALPSNLAAASSWDPEAAYEYGALIGLELRAQGYGMSLGGGVNLTREPRDGRTFEYQGEDPLLAGTLVGNFVKGVQSQHIIGDLKHFALNDQESGRHAVDANADERTMRETDLLPFQIALGISDAGAVMCSYNRVNGDYACENKHLLTDILRNDLHFKGFVISDWGATHSTVKASQAGLDQEQPEHYFFGDDLKRAVKSGEISQTELDDHVHRVLRPIFASGLFDNPVVRQVPNVEGGRAIAKRIAGESIVLLKNANGVLPLNPTQLHSVVLIGGHADKGTLTGGGSAQVDPPGGSPVPRPASSAHGLMGPFQRITWMPGSPLDALQKEMVGVQVSYVEGDRLAEAASAAKAADVAIVFGYQWESEGFDLKTLSLDDDQNRLIEAVVQANPHTIVVLENGSPVTMPWIDRASGVVEAWYPGIAGADALADVLTGKVNPTGKLAITFPKSDSDLPHPRLVTPPSSSEPTFPTISSNTTNVMAVLSKGLPPFDVHYDEKLKVGYKWYDAENKPPLFPFGFGLSYTTYAYSELAVRDEDSVTVTFKLRNTGDRAGTEIAQVYSSLPAAAGEPPKRLVGWQRVHLDPGESKNVSIPIDKKLLTIYEMTANSWKLIPGTYVFMVGGSSQNLSLKHALDLD